MAKQANRIKELRDEKNMTQIRLSIELGVSQETVSAYEIGKHYPSVKSLMLMAELFGVSMDYIMGISTVRNAVLEEGLPDSEVKLLRLYRQLDKLKKEKTYAYMQGLSDEK
ncbi:MAG: helix-turn-helix domain-containing protein [Oscillospiraceae bacterium]|nr:helix-turn-helix domain-containing protein [Oscillospiraceae bacterium]